MKFNFIGGHGRKALVASVAATITTGGSKDFGQFESGQFSRLTGYCSTIGSLTIRIRTGASSGVFHVSSNWACNSGPALLDTLNYGQFTAVDITAAQSTAYTLLVNGEPVR